MWQHSYIRHVANRRNVRPCSPRWYTGVTIHNVLAGSSQAWIAVVSGWTRRTSAAPAATCDKCRGMVPPWLQCHTPISLRALNAYHPASNPVLLLCHWLLRHTAFYTSKRLGYRRDDARLRQYLSQTTLCPRKNYNTVYVAITLANNVGF